MKYCCDMMKASVYCSNENSVYGGEIIDKVIYFDSAFDEYGIPIYDQLKGEANSIIEIKFCPWCGQKLPDSKRDEWCDSLERLSYDPFSDEIPEVYKTSKWYTEKEEQK